LEIVEVDRREEVERGRRPVSVSAERARAVAEIEVGLARTVWEEASACVDAAVAVGDWPRQGRWVCGMKASHCRRRARCVGILSWHGSRLREAEGHARLLGILVTGIHAHFWPLGMLRVRPPGCRDWIKKSWPLCRCRSDRLAACVVEGTKLQALASNVRHTIFFLHLASGSRSLRCFATGAPLLLANAALQAHCRFSVDIFQFPRSIAESSEREGSVHAAERAIFQVRIKQRQPHPH
ncbi:hypothetical protein KCV06_g201, partial [Aureobasidium melanogenum]